ncbi:hypothetical protein [Glycomyces salinus]|uniref:hypothetical protein n=1 Tax=Glycomyces salinus TaxID=980294 RepID=UPI0018ECD35E|nr:hypothetical protein [Glycomyces salinus]
MESDRKPTLGRRGLLLGAAGAGVAAALGAASPARAAIPGFPEFTRLGAALDKSSLDYNPTDELIFPSIRLAAGRVRNPLGKWYMYYAPHDDPGGICLAYADSLEGPWHEFAHNPVISNDWRGHFSVPHVSSPHAVWNPRDRRMYLFFHGNNRTTRVATSVDGRHFVYGGIVLHTDMVGAGLHEASYARVVPHPVKDDLYIMLYMGRQGQTRKIFIGWSHDLGSGWKFKREPLISPREGEGGQLSGAHYWSRNGGGHVVYHSGAGTMHAAYVGTGFDREDHLGVFYTEPVATRAAAPSFAEEDGHLYMYYEAGARGNTNIAIARA